ncbi:PQQ-binding-like beta-propeller repeat protein [Micromonospora sp. BRA006-A]|nr:PQQ-binding-like beta-propeller repeat protein [Micromonospora sp. BRA006-A]
MLDPATGTLRWRHPGYPVRTASGGLLLENPARPARAVQAVDPDSGEVRWTLPVPGQEVGYRRDDHGVTQLVLVTPQGRVTVYDADSGAVAHTGRVAPAADRAAYRYAQVVADLLLVEDARGTVTGYGLDRLDERWSLPVGSRAGLWFADCAGMVCLRDQVGGAQALDPATGRPAWTDERWLGMGPVGDRLIAAERGVGEELELSALDPPTGRVLARLGRWRVSGNDLPSGPLLGLRTLTEDRTLVGALDVAAGQVRIRGSCPAPGPSARTRVRNWCACVRPAAWRSGRPAADHQLACAGAGGSGVDSGRSTYAIPPLPTCQALWNGARGTVRRTRSSSGAYGSLSTGSPSAVKPASTMRCPRVS